MICAACSRELPAGFPGAVVTCTCGSAVRLPAPSAAPPLAGGPYRGSAATPAFDDREITCTFCGNLCSSLVRVCPHCDVRFDNIRCGRCYTLQAPGSFTCHRCNHSLELEPLLDTTDAPCPRCQVALEAAGGREGWQDARVHECPRCGGIFVPRDALAEMLHRAEIEGPFQVPKRAPLIPLEAIRYLACPLCRASMNRVNFGKVSGVIVDVCRAHGTWFDAGELTRIVSFAAGGGLVKARSREASERKDAASAAHLQNQLDHFAEDRLDRRGKERAEQWRSFLRDLLFW